MSYWNPVFPKSLALSRFVDDHTLNNDFYWHTVLTRILACKFSRELDASDVIGASKHLPADVEAFRFPHRFADWKSGISDHENWVRLNTLLASTAYLERYIYEIALLAFSNDPGLLLGKTRSANGVHFLKNGIPIRGLQVIELFTKGSWFSRTKFLGNYFDCSAIPRPRIEELEAIRLLRNRIAHRFGREFIAEAGKFTSGHVNPERLSEKRLKTYLQTINDIAKDVEAAIYTQHVGNFELVLFWHNWDKRENHQSWKNWTDPRKLRYGISKYILHGPAPKAKVFEPIIKYYDAA